MSDLPNLCAECGEEGGVEETVAKVDGSARLLDLCEECRAREKGEPKKQFLFEFDSTWIEARTKSGARAVLMGDDNLRDEILSDHEVTKEELSK